MYLKELRITKDDGSIIRKIKFRKGLNAVIDQEASKKHNRVGKSTFLRLIDIALGSKDKKYLYIDSELGGKNEELEKQIKIEKLSVELDVVDNLSSRKNENKLKVELYPGGRRYVDGVKFNQDDYCEKLNKLMFNNSGKPTFRQLISSFVRVDVKKISTSF